MKKVFRKWYNTESGALPELPKNYRDFKPQIVSAIVVDDEGKKSVTTISSADIVTLANARKNGVSLGDDYLDNMPTDALEYLLAKIKKV